MKFLRYVRRQSLLIAFVAVLSLFGCKETPIIGGTVVREKLADGVFEGSYKGGPNKAIVKVTIQAQKIIKIEIVEHDAWKGKKAEPVIPQRIIDQQSTAVDAVSGATNSSRVIMNAVQNALEQSYSKFAATPTP